MQALERMLVEIQQEAEIAAPWTGMPRISERVLDAMRRVPRDLFVPEEMRSQAWVNAPLPIGSGQTISQPFIVALMTELVDPAPGKKILDIGGGSGWQAAILAELGAEVHSVEIRPELAKAAEERLARLGLDDRVQVHVADGKLGWPEAAPYDGVVVAAAARAIPEAWVEQMKIGARLVAPVGEPHGPQQLVLGIKEAEGRLRTRPVLPVAFVPLV